ncbi:hypothetical protein S83_001006, partial [Arachis hypogaea]
IPNLACGVQYLNPSNKFVLCIYRKFLSSCKEQMPLYASSLLAMIWTLLEQSRIDKIRILGCNSLVDFIKCQAPTTDRLLALLSFVMAEVDEKF